MFREHGFEGVDVERIARAVHVTKPALYRAFGDKPTLLLKAVERYAMTYGAPMIAAFQAEPDIHKAVTAFARRPSTPLLEGRVGGCMMAAAVLGQSERVGEIRSYVAKGFAATADIFAQRFEQEMMAGRLTRRPSARVRGRALIDLMQGLLLRRHSARGTTPRRPELCSPDSWGRTRLGGTDVPGLNSRYESNGTSLGVVPAPA